MQTKGSRSLLLTSLREQTFRCAAKIAPLIRSLRHGSKKAAAEGAAIWYNKQLVVARAARSTLGGCPCSSYPSRRPTTPQVLV